MTLVPSTFGVSVYLRLLLPIRIRASGPARYPSLVTRVTRWAQVSLRSLACIPVFKNTLCVLVQMFYIPPPARLPQLAPDRSYSQWFMTYCVDVLAFQHQNVRSILQAS